MSEQISAPPTVWRTLLHAWTWFFFGLSALNYWVATNYDTETWVNFKLFGAMGLMVVFAVIQAIYLSAHVKNEDSEAEDPASQNATSTSSTSTPAKGAE